MKSDSECTSETLVDYGCRLPQREALDILWMTDPRRDWPTQREAKVVRYEQILRGHLRRKLTPRRQWRMKELLLRESHAILANFPLPAPTVSVNRNEDEIAVEITLPFSLSEITITSETK